MAITDKIISFWKQVRLKSSDMFTLFKVGIGIKSPTHKLHVKDTTDPIKLEGVQSDTSSSTKFLVLDGSNVVKHATGSGKTTEEVQDIVGAMFTSNTETRIAATYEDSDGTIDLVVDAIPVDLTVDGAGTVHTNNITDLHGAGVSGSANQLLTDDGDGTITSESELTFGSDTLELGGDDSTSITIQRKTHGDSSGGQLVFRAGDGTGTNKGGGILRFHGGRGTGTGASGEIRFSVASSVSSGSTQHSDPVTRILTLTDANATVVGNIVVTGTVDGIDIAARDHDAVTLANTNYLSLSGQEITGGTVPVASGGTGSTSASDARTALGVDASGTDNSTNVTLAGSLDYITLSGQEITRNAIDLAADVTGTLPVGNGGTGSTTFTSGHILRGNGTSGFTANSDLQFDGNNLNIQSSTSAKPLVSINSTNTDAEAPELQLIKGTAGADGDDLGKIKFSNRQQ